MTTDLILVYGIIYKCTNLINGKIYIGQTIKKLEVRRKEHERDSKKGRGYYFANAISKYKEENFQWEIIDSASSMKELNYKEGLHIRWNLGNSYNLVLGGDSFGNAWLLRSKDDYNAWRKKISDTKIRNRSSAGSRNSRYGKGYLVVGENNPMFGKKHTPEAIEASRLGVIAFWQSDKGIVRKLETASRLSACNTGGGNVKAKKVVCIETNEIFLCMKDLCTLLSISVYNLKKSINNNVKINNFTYQFL